jgi:hypothetical protein
MGTFNLRRTCAAVAAALVLTAPVLANAASTITTGTATPLTASAQLDFQVVVPKVLFLQVGAGSLMGANTTVNQIAFTVPGGTIGNGTAVVASAASGDLGNGVVTARVVGNNGNVTLSSTTTGALTDAAGDTLSYTQIGTAATAGATGNLLLPPALADAATTTETLTAVKNVVNMDAKWTFSFLNTAVVPPGTYGGVNANNSRVTYTASMP